MSNPLRRRWRYGFAVLATGLLVWFVGPAALAETLRGAHPVWLLLYLGTFFLVPVLYGIQLHGALRIAGYQMPANMVIAAATQAWGLGTLTPVRAGDLSLAYFLGDRVPAGDAIAVVSIDKLLSLVTLAALALAGGMLISLPNGADRVLVAGATLALGGTMVALAVVSVRGADLPVRAMARKWWGPRAEAAWERMRILVSSPRLLAWCLTMTVLRWMYICAGNLLLFRAVAAHPHFPHVVAATAVGRIISLVPVSIGGIGIKEPAQIVIYGAADVPANAVLAASVLGLACGMVVAAAAPLIASAIHRRELQAT